MTQAARQPVDLAAVFDLATLTDVHWSPDGRTIAVVVARPDLKANLDRSAIWLVDSTGQAPPRQLTAGQNSDRMPRWSPDGRQLAFVSNRSGTDQVWVIPTDGGEARLLAGEEAGVGPVATDDFYAALEWSPDGSQVAFVAQEPAPPQPGGGEEDPYATDARVVGRSDGEGYGEIRRLHVYSVPAAGGPARLLTPGDYHSGDFRWSPDGRQIAFVSNRSGDEEAVRGSIDKNFDLWLLDVASGETRQLTTNPGPDIGPRWSPDGQSIAYTSVPRCGSHRDVFQLTIISAEGGAGRCLTEQEGPHVDRLHDACWSPDGRAIYCTAARRAANVILAVPADATAPARTVVGGDYLCEWATLSPDGKRLAFTIQGPDRPPELYVAPAEGGEEPRCLTAFNAGWRDRAIAPTHIRRWRAPDGLEIEGMLTLPPTHAPGQRHPLLLNPHGGPHSRSSLGFSAEGQYWAAQGYAVFCPNFRGTMGYGQAFIDADRGDFGGGDFADVMAGVDDLIEAGLADPDRLAIMGTSYGGYLTAWAIGHTDRFKAAVAVEAVTNLQSMYGQTDIQSWVEWEFGYPWEVLDRLAAHSPMTFVGNVRTPTLIIHGEADRRVPLPQSLELYTSLRRLGVETQLVLYPREGHGIKEPRHRRDLLLRVAEWLGRHLESH